MLGSSARSTCTLAEILSQPDIWRTALSEAASNNAYQSASRKASVRKEWLFVGAGKQARAWLDAGLPLATIAVNVSAKEFRDDNFLEGLFAILTETALDPRCLELERTESVLMNRAQTTDPSSRH
jgi:EAL domain-containing protein (putative c-di-GMP-specific phosphodiesterase class I)